MAMMLHTFENTVDSRLGSFGMTAGKLVPLESFYKDPEATKRIKFYVLQSIINEVSVSGSLNTVLHIPYMHHLLIEWEKVTYRLADAQCLGLWKSAVKNLQPGCPNAPTHLPHPLDWRLNAINKIVWLKLKSQISKLLEILCP